MVPSPLELELSSCCTGSSRKLGFPIWTVKHQVPHFHEGLAWVPIMKCPFYLLPPFCRFLTTARWCARLIILRERTDGKVCGKKRSKLRKISLDSFSLFPL